MNWFKRYLAWLDKRAAEEAAAAQHVEVVAYLDNGEIHRVVERSNSCRPFGEFVTGMREAELTADRIGRNGCWHNGVRYPAARITRIELRELP